MIVVADTSPILYLFVIDQVGVLQRLYGTVIIPGAVAAELLAPASPTPVRSWISNSPGWIHVRSATPEQLEAVSAELDLGERMAIALATAFSADLLLIDDARGRMKPVVATWLSRERWVSCARPPSRGSSMSKRRSIG